MYKEGRKGKDTACTPYHGTQTWLILLRKKIAKCCKGLYIYESFMYTNGKYV